MRIQCPDNLRVPSVGSSREGESGPKIRPKGVVDGRQVNIPVLTFDRYRGTKKAMGDQYWIQAETFEVLKAGRKTMLEPRRDTAS